MLQKMVMEYLFNEENKQKVIDELNKNVNIPIINEDTEKKLFLLSMKSLKMLWEKF